MKKRKGDHFMDYADVVETACLTGPPSLAPYSGFARKLINVFLCITQVFTKTIKPNTFTYSSNNFILYQFGFCCVYIVFAANNLEQVFGYYAKILLVSIHEFNYFRLLPIISLLWRLISESTWPCWPFLLSSSVGFANSSTFRPSRYSPTSSNPALSFSFFTTSFTICRTFRHVLLSALGRHSLYSIFTRFKGSGYQFIN